MLKRLPNAYFKKGSGYNFFYTGKSFKEIRLRPDFEPPEDTPSLLCRRMGTYYWWYKGMGWETEESLTAEDLRALAMESENRKRIKLEKAHALMAMREQLDGRQKRSPISQEVKQAVWVRDNGRCVECGSNRALEFDHIIPVAMGGANTERNLQLLCEACNRRKGPTLG